MVLICMAMKQDVLYRLYAVWLLASWANAVLSVMVGLVPKSAVMLTQHGCATTQLEPDLGCLLSLCAALQVLPKPWTLIHALVQGKLGFGSNCA